jgi:hypothetical protein
MYIEETVRWYCIPSRKPTWIQEQRSKSRSGPIFLSFQMRQWLTFWFPLCCRNNWLISRRLICVYALGASRVRHFSSASPITSFSLLLKMFSNLILRSIWPTGSAPLEVFWISLPHKHQPWPVGTAKKGIREGREEDEHRQGELQWEELRFIPTTIFQFLLRHRLVGQEMMPCEPV